MAKKATPNRTPQARPKKVIKTATKRAGKKTGNKGHRVGTVSLQPGHPHFSREAHARLPYTPVSQSVRVSFSTPATGFTNYVLLVAPFHYNVSGHPHLTNAIGISSRGTAAPTAATDSNRAWHRAFNLEGFDQKLRASRCSFRVSCTGTSAGLVPPGRVYSGVLSGMVDLDEWTDWDTLGNWLISRKEAVPASSAELMNKPAARVLRPLDTVAYDTFTDYVSEFSTTSMHAASIGSELCTGFLVIPRASLEVQWNVDIDVEYTCIFTRNALMQSTHKCHASKPNSAWNMASAAAERAAADLKALVPYIPTIARGARAALTAM